MNGQVLNTENVAREAQVARKSVAAYFSILEETLVGHWLPAWQPRATVREAAHPKFYWFDPGVARAAAGRAFDKLDSLWRGFALETLLFHELRVHNHVAKRERPISCYCTRAGAEIDFIIELERKALERKPLIVGIEVKLARRWDRAFDAPMLGVQVVGVTPDATIPVLGGEISRVHCDAYFTYTGDIAIRAWVKAGSGWSLNQVYEGHGSGGVNMAATAEGYAACLAETLRDAAVRIAADAKAAAAARAAPPAEERM